MTRQLDVVANPDAEDASYRPYLLVLQSDLVAGLSSTIVAPLVPRADMAGAHRLNPIMTIDGHEFWLATHELFAVDRHALGKTVASLAEQRDAVIAALDLLFTGF
jgi:toxin CcdB